jgi:hypothetical protein
MKKEMQEKLKNSYDNLKKIEEPNKCTLKIDLIQMMDPLEYDKTMIKSRKINLIFQENDVGVV